eukprot:gene10461-417_t
MTGVARALRITARLLWEPPSGPPAAPRELYDVLVAGHPEIRRDARQHDSHAALQWLLDQALEDVSLVHQLSAAGPPIGAPPGEDSFDERARWQLRHWRAHPTRELFEHCITRDIRCLGCNRRSRHLLTAAHNLQVRIPAGGEDDPVSLADCVGTASIRSTVGGEEAVACDGCGGAKSDRTHDDLLWNAPRYLVVQLVRFRFNPDTGEQRKVQRPVLLPEGLLPLRGLKAGAPGCAPVDVRYTAVSAVYHQGATTRSGHYWSIIRGRCAGQFSWRLANDDRIGFPEALPAGRLYSAPEAAKRLYMVVLERVDGVPAGERALQRNDL